MHYFSFFQQLLISVDPPYLVRTSIFKQNERTDKGVPNQGQVTDPANLNSIALNFRNSSQYQKVFQHEIFIVVPCFTPVCTISSHCADDLRKLPFVSHLLVKETVPAFFIELPSNLNLTYHNPLFSLSLSARANVKQSLKAESEASISSRPQLPNVLIVSKQTMSGTTKGAKGNMGFWRTCSNSKLPSLIPAWKEQMQRFKKKRAGVRLQEWNSAALVNTDKQRGLYHRISGLLLSLQ